MDDHTQITYTLTDAAKLMHISKPTMLKLANRADFPSIKIGARWIINTERLQYWLDEQVRQKVFHPYIKSLNQCSC